MDSREKLYGVDIAFSLPAFLSFFPFFSFSFYLSHMPPADELQNITKHGRFPCYFYQRESKTRYLQFKIMQICGKTHVLSLKIFAKRERDRNYISFRCFSFSLSNSTLKFGCNEREEISAML